MSLTKLSKTVYFLIILLVVTSCTNVGLPKEGRNGNASPTVSYNIVRESQIVYRSINELFLESDLIVTGKVVAEKEIINTARDPDDNKKEHPTMFSIGQIYEVEIGSILQGKAPKTIYVVQYQGTFNKNEIVPDKTYYESIKHSFNIIPMTVASSYLMYLRSSPYSYGDYPADILYGGIGHPWLFDTTNLDCVSVVDSNPSIKDFFPTTSYDVIFRSIQMAKDGKNPSTDQGYPEPLEKSSFCEEGKLKRAYPEPTP
ncbi:MAG TPA: hypothetical protein PJ988_11570 [Anaerolinea sp.]|nr:hypothetical protein [Anaerolinea sp.]